MIKQKDIENKAIKKEEQKQRYFFPRLGRSILARSMQEAIKIINKIKN
jgi:hypothetical protein